MMMLAEFSGGYTRIPFESTAERKNIRISAGRRNLADRQLRMLQQFICMRKALVTQKCPQGNPVQLFPYHFP